MGTSDEKHSNHSINAPVPSPDRANFQLPPSGSPERLQIERKLVRKLDVRLLPMIVVIFIMNYIDRNGVTTARLKGMQQDLHLNDVQYATVIAILFVSYCPAQIPSNMILNKVTRPSVYIGVCTVLWGITSALTGITHNFAGIIACRVFIGLPESAFYPGAMYVLTRWYTKKELAFRSAFLYAGLLLSNAFGTLIAAGILSNMEGKRGIRAWRWLFYIEGAMTVLVGLAAIYILPDYPHNTRWMSPIECRVAQARLSEDTGEADKDSIEDSPIRGLLMALRDPKVGLFALMTITQLLGLSFGQFFPTLTRTLTSGATSALLLAAPPWIIAAIICCFNAWHADRSGERFFHISGWWWSVVLGFIISLSTGSTPARYISLFLMAIGYVGSGITLTWVANSIPRPPAKRAAAIGIVNGLGNLGTVMGSYTWKSAWSPNYHQSMAISMGSLLISIVLCLDANCKLVIRQMLMRENRRLDADERSALDSSAIQRVAEAAKLEGITFEEALDRRKGFRYLF